MTPEEKAAIIKEVTRRWLGSETVGAGLVEQILDAADYWELLDELETECVEKLLNKRGAE